MDPVSCLRDAMRPRGAAELIPPLELLEAAVCQDDARLAALADLVTVEPESLGPVAQLAALPLLQAAGRRLAQAG